MAEVFLSYAKDDADKVQVLEDALAALDIIVWRDRSGIRSGADFWDVIERELEQAEVVVVCCSNASLQNANVRKEISLAQHRHVPLLLVAIDPPRSLKRGIQIIELQLDDLSTWTGEIQSEPFLKLVSAIGDAIKSDEIKRVKLKRLYPDLLAKKAEDAAALKRKEEVAKVQAETDARIKREQEAKDTRIKLEQEAKAKAEFEQANADFAAAQRRRFEELPIAKAAQRAKEEADRCRRGLAEAQTAFERVKNVALISSALQNQGGCGTAVLFWLGVVSSLAFLAEMAQYGGKVFMNLELALVCFAWVALVRQPRVSFNPSALSYDSRARRAEDAKTASAKADAARQQAQAAADEAWKPFQRAIDAFALKRPGA